MNFIIIFQTIFTCLAFDQIIIDQSYLENDYLYRLQEVEQMVTQYVNNATFIFEPLQNTIEQNIAVELFFEFPSDGHVDMDFQIILKSDAVFNNQSKFASSRDLNGQLLRKSHRFILIPGYTYEEGDYFMISHFSNDSLIKPYQYTIKITISESAICPNMCNKEKQYGYCEAAGGQCNCIPGKIDLDCSINAQQITQDAELNLHISDAYKYLYFQPETEITQEGMITFDLLNFEQITIYLLLENQIVGIPSQYYYDYKFNFTEIGSQSQLINLTLLKFNNIFSRYERLLIDLEASKPVTISIKLNIKTKINEWKPYIFWGSIFITLIFTFGFVGYFQYQDKYNSHIIDLNAPGYSKYWKLVDDFMPKITYKEACDTQKSTSYEDVICQVCQSEYQESDICRITPCKHLFHAICLEKWLKVQKICPVCEAKISEESLDLLHEDQCFHQKLSKLMKKRDEMKKQNEPNQQLPGELIVQYL